jgi:hypothetical protein
MSSVLDVLQKSNKTMVSELTKSDIAAHCKEPECVKEVSEIVQKLNSVFKTKFKNFMNFDTEGNHLNFLVVQNKIYYKMIPMKKKNYKKLPDNIFCLHRQVNNYLCYKNCKIKCQCIIHLY